MELTRSAEALSDKVVLVDEVPLLAEQGAAQKPWYKRAAVAWVLCAVGWLCFLAALMSRSGDESRGAPPPTQPPAPASPLLSFLVVGDWGRQGAYNGTRVAAAMGAVATRLRPRPRFVLSTGDNIYEQGMRNVSDPLFDATFSRVFTHPALDTPWYLAMGNHDWYSPGNVSAQVDPAMRARDSRWLGLQAGTRSFYASAADVTPLLTLVFVDTSPWLLSYRSKKGSMNWTQGGILGVGEAAYDSLAGRLAWAAWEDSAAAGLEAQLSACTSRWRIVVGHHPIYSYAGRHSNTVELTRLNGILRRGGAHAYLNGHDHVLQLIVPPTAASWPMAAGPVYLTSGAGSKCSNDVAPPPPDGSLLFSHGWQGFNSIELNATALRLLSYDVDGRLLHSYEQPWAATPLCGSTQDGRVPLRADADPRCGPPPAPAADNAGFVRDASSAPENQASSGGATGPVAFDNYQLVGSLQLSGDSWDSVAYDAANQVLYLGRRGDGLAYVDARDPTALRSLDTVPGISGARGVLLMPQLGLGASLSSGAALFTLPSVANGFQPTVLGTAAFDPALGSPADGAFLPQSATMALTFPDRPANTPGSVALFQLPAAVLSAAAARAAPTPCGSACFKYASAAAGTSATAGMYGGGMRAPRAAPDGASLWVLLVADSIAVRVNGTSGAELQSVDLRASGCAAPAGADLDALNGVLFVACRGGALPGNMGWAGPLLLALNAATGAPLYHSRVGRNVDSVVYSPPVGGRTGRVFVSCGGDATLMVFEQMPPGAPVPYRPLEAISTRMGAKTLAVDPARRLIFTAAPTGSVKYSGQQLSTVSPGGAAPELFDVNAWQNATYTLLAYRALN